MLIHLLLLLHLLIEFSSVLTIIYYLILLKHFKIQINICVLSFNYILFTMFLIIIHNIVQPRTDLMGELVRINNEQ